MTLRRRKQLRCVILKLSICLSVCLSVVCPSVRPSVRPSIHPSIYLSLCLSPRLSVSLSFSDTQTVLYFSVIGLNLSWFFLHYPLLYTSLHETEPTYDSLIFIF